ncbi:hypothetical protein BDV41DRAFT_541318 [Aspergillus transmontanensis]|uniref:Secreted protein n=1 Tax=Aspergillus transmontanensis TaxID=1034304 RepID=A0A5N6VVF2_9EURO|nr:hypothetical protein BDV41DRAFT_541318 [Aspergillus transmontanensis]
MPDSPCRPILICLWFSRSILFVPLTHQSPFSLVSDSAQVLYLPFDYSGSRFILRPNIACTEISLSTLMQKRRSVFFHSMSSIVDQKQFPSFCC